MDGKKLKQTLTSGFLGNNPTFRLVLGTCPTIAITTTAMNGIGMGLATTFVLICSNVLISILRDLIPDKVRIPAYIMIIATFVTLVEMILRKFMPDLYASLGMFISLIVVNCIILARAEAYASQNTPFYSAMDGLGMGLGFTASITLIAICRELLGAGELFGMTVLGDWFPTIGVLTAPAGGFLMYGFLMAAFNAIYAAVKNRSKKEA